MIAVLSGPRTMHLIQLFYCAFGKHVRSRGHAHQDGAVFRSRCRGCGKPMVRTASGWRVDNDPSLEGK
jgi:hypothetical protein